MPDFVDAWYNLAIAYENSGQIPEARKSYKKVLELEPSHLEAENNLSLLSAKETD